MANAEKGSGELRRAATPAELEAIARASLNGKAPGAEARKRHRLAESYLPWEARWRAGKALRERVPREQHAGWTPPGNRPDPIRLLIESNRTRLEHLVPIRHGRMLTSAFAFLRGSACVMAWDLARTPATGIYVQACGDCHLMNFGAFATPERRLNFDINDFDETLPAPWEWDVKRLAASCAVAARYLGHSRAEAAAAAEAAIRSYRKAMGRYARLRLIEIWYDHVDLEQLIETLPNPERRRRVRERIAKVRQRGVADHDFPKLAERNGGKPHIKDNPPLIYHVPEIESREFHEGLTQAHFEYLKSLSPHYRVIIERYKLCDVAMKVVGVGSVGTRCAVALLMAADDDPLFLQIKEANASVLEPYAGPSEFANHGERVVIGQRFMQAASDILLGWCHGIVRDRHYYVRQLRDMKMSVTLETLDPVGLRFYAKMCGRVLARAHARSSDAAVLAGYMGNGTVFDEAVAAFAMDYSAQTDRDYKLFGEAVGAGRLQAASS